MSSLPFAEGETPTRLRPGLFWLLVAVLVTIHVVLAWLGRQPAVTTGHDDALYLALGRALRGFSYEELHYVPSAWHAQYPPGYPAMLALAGALFGDGITVYTTLSLLCSAAALLLFTGAMRQVAGEVPALALLAACAVNPDLIAHAGDVSTEAPFMAASALTLWALVPVPGGTDRPRLAGAGALAACLIRSAGLPLLLALLVHWLLQRRWRHAATLAAVAALTVGSWMLWTVVAPHQTVGRSYVADFTGGRGSVVAGSAFGPMLARFQQYFASALPSALSLTPVPGTAADNLIHLVLLVTLLVIGVLVTWRRWRALALFLLLYCGLLLAWPWIQTRFLYPVVPVLWVVLLLGALALGRRFGRWLAPATGGVLLVSALFGGTRETLTTARWWSCDRRDPLQSAACFTEDQRSYFAAAAWVRKHTPPEAVFLTAKDATWYYYSGRRVVRSIPIQQVDPDRLLQYLNDAGVSYVVLGNVKDNETERFSWMLRRICRSLEIEARFPPRTYLFGLRPAPGDDQACRALVEYHALRRSQ